MKREENYDPWLNLSLSPPQPETEPSVSAPIQQLHQPHQAMVFSAPLQFFYMPQVLIPSHQHDHNNQDQPSSSRQVLVPEVSLQDQYQALMMRQLNPNTITPQYHSPSPAAPFEMPELIPEITLASLQDEDQDEAGPSRQPRVSRRLPLQPLKEGKSLDITPPHPWGTCRRAQVQSLDELLSKGMNLIKGQVQCKRCNKVYTMEFDLQNKFLDVAEYIRHKKRDMHDRAPSVWMNPVLPNCKECHMENCAKPVILKKITTNWLFLLLGQMLGCCKLGHLKYFCKHTRTHRTGAKDRVLYLTYMGLCKQLDPNGPFDV